MIESRQLGTGARTAQRELQSAAGGFSRMLKNSRIWADFEMTHKRDSRKFAHSRVLVDALCTPQTPYVSILSDGNGSIFPGWCIALEVERKHRHDHLKRGEGLCLS
jgi:hypothetical protein